MSGVIETMGKKQRFLRPDLVYGLILCAICLYLFRGMIFGTRLLYGSDFNTFYLGMKQFLYNEIHENHSIPFWNPYLFSGMPYWADFSSAIFYPLNILFILIVPEKAYGCSMLIHFILSALFMYGLAKSFEMNRTGSFIAALVFILNHFIMSNLMAGQMCRVQTYTWIPLILYFARQSLSSRRYYLFSCMAGFFWGIQILSGSPQDAFYTYLAVVLLYACSLKFDGSLNGIFKPFAGASAVFLLGSGIASIQIIPAFEFINHSVRAAHDSYELITMASFPLEGLITSIMPHFFGNYTTADFWVSDMPWSLPVYNLYVGIIPLMLLAYFSFRSTGEKRDTYFVLILALLALVLSFGHHTPLYKLAYMLPGFDRFRAPSKIIVLWVLAFSLLAGRGADNFLSYSGTKKDRRLPILFSFLIVIMGVDILFLIDRSFVPEFFSFFFIGNPESDRMDQVVQLITAEYHRFTLLIAASTFFFLLHMRGILKPRTSSLVICVLLIADLGFVNKGAVQYDDHFYTLTRATKKGLSSTLDRDKTVFRVGSFAHGQSPNLEMYLGYQTVGGYTPLFLNRYHEYLRFYSGPKSKRSFVYYYYGRDDGSKTRLMDLLNVKYEILYSEKNTVYRETYLPRAFIVPTYKVIDSDAVLKTLVQPEFDPRKVVLLEEEDMTPDIGKPFPKDSPPVSGNVELAHFSPDLIALKTESSSPGYLFLSEVFYPGWNALVDGRPVRIVRGNYLFRVIPLPKGSHQVRLVFNPTSIRLGIMVTILSLLMVMLISLRSYREKLPLIRRKESNLNS